MAIRTIHESDDALTIEITLAALEEIKRVERRLGMWFGISIAMTVAGIVAFAFLVLY
jgi:hypothetical protein